ncbi:Pkinase-domain-containing protein [Aulographum hederae CBS 113979]|uniref:Serine/threonine-protein kinase BUR1 n=1 Tax=Aulographum hederae CBS 113979 TaxID=1176131 RepID=A0A6G1GKE8_9PEZI|nr:Pkinase-domain-containing protein [Aulographum hederae CBS 113979]
MTQLGPPGRIFHGCSPIAQYEFMGKLGEGTFGEVYKARSLRTGAIVALKKILMHNEKDGFPITALREIKLLKLLSHVNVLKLEEMAIERNRSDVRQRAVMYMVTPYMDHDLSGLLDNPELFQGLKYLHDSNILHRDMKAANLLISNRGILQIGDFGLARDYDGPTPLPGRGGGEATREYTTLVVTRWYRPPELLLQLRRYTTAIDMWGAGCVFGEMFKRKPILAGSSDLNQANIIFDLVGSPTEANMPGWSALPGCEGVKEFASRRGNITQVFGNQSPEALHLLQDLLKLDWRKRLTAVDALEHPYFKAYPLPARPEDIPRFPDSHELDRRNARGGEKRALPPAPAGGTVGLGHDGQWNGSSGHGASWMNGGRQGGSWGRDMPRGPPPPPPGRSHDNRGPYDRAPAGPPPRRTPWGNTSAHPQGSLPDDPYGSGAVQRHPLPARVPNAVSSFPPSGGQPPRRGQHGNSNVDSYVPSYSKDDHTPRGNGEGRNSKDRDEGLRSRDGRDGRDGRGYDRRSTYHDPDRPAPDRYYNRSDGQRTRSRSPGNNRDRTNYRDRAPGAYDRR